MRELKDELSRVEHENEALVREISAIRQGPGAKISPELASQTYSLRQIVLGRGTGGYDDDDVPGDEALQVVIEPRDGDGHPIKAPGAVHVEVLEITAEGLKTPLSSWDVPPEKVRRVWKSGFLSTGYVLILPWQNWPTSEKVRVVARFTLPDGRLFEAEKDVTVHLTPVARRKTKPAPLDLDGPGLQVPEPLPLPRKGPASESTSAKPWWAVPRAAAPAPAPAVVTWRPAPGATISAKVTLERPVPLDYEPGEDP